MSIDRDTAKHVHEAFRKTVIEFAAAHNLTLKKSNCSYDPDGQLRFAISLNAIPVEGEASMEQKEFERTAYMFGLKAEQYGATFTTRTGTYRLVAIKPRSPKYPFIGEDTRTKKRFKFTERAIESIRPVPSLKLSTGSLLRTI